MDLDDLGEIAAISDPLERARVLTNVITQHQGVVEEAAKLRRAAIAEARAAGVKLEDIGRAAGVSTGRVWQIGQVKNGIPTGWLLPPTAAGVERPIAISGSRAAGADGGAIDGAIRPLGALLSRVRCRVFNGPVGVGIEVLTHVADHYRPPGLGSLSGILGHANVVREVEYVLIVGGGHGTQEEVDLAASMGKRLIPMAASGGAAVRAYERMQREENLRAWMRPEDFAALGPASGEQYAEIVERILTSEQESEAGA